MKLYITNILAFFKADVLDMPMEKKNHYCNFITLFQPQSTNIIRKDFRPCISLDNNC